MSKSQNPFVVTGRIKPEYFCDRVSECARLVSALTNGNNMVIVSPRRMGKTGLIHFFYEKPEIADGYHTFFFDILHTTGFRELVYQLSRAIFVTLAPKGTKILGRFLQTLKSLAGKFGFDPVAGTPTFSLELGDIPHPELTLEEIFTYLGQADKPCLVAIDEFQQIANYPEKNVEALLRSYVQRVSNAHFIFAGSEFHVMQEMFSSVARPFYNSADVMELKAIDLQVYKSFVADNMRNGNRQIDVALVEKVYRLFRGNTYAMQKTFNEVYTMLGEGGCCGQDQVVEAIRNIIDSKEVLFREQLSLIPERHKALLYAIASDGEVEHITSGQFVREHKLASASAVQHSVAQLMKLGVVTRLSGRYSLNDPLFALWINTLYGPQTLEQTFDRL